MKMMTFYKGKEFTMNRTTIVRIIALALVLALFATLIPAIVFAADSGKVTVSASADKITLHLEGVGTSGTAEIRRLDADAYLTADTLNGLSKTAGAGEKVGSYTCGTTADVSFDRFSGGKDRLYSKYYVVQDGKILAGPFYATQIASQRSTPAFEMDTIKGLVLEDDSTLAMAKDVGASNTVINMNLCDLVVANEDANGNPIDNSGKSGLIAFQSNGKTYYFSEGYVNGLKSQIASYSKEGINVILVCIAWRSGCPATYPASLLYVKVNENKQTMAFNTSNALGAGYWTASMEFLADTFSRSAEEGLVNKFVIGNEIDCSYDWNLLQPSLDANGNHQRLPLDTYMEEYTRTLRLADLAVKKYNSEAQVLVSFTHNWAMNRYDSNKNTGTSAQYNSYAPKEMLDWMNSHIKAQGDFNWGLALHPYPVDHFTSNPLTDDIKRGSSMPITGDFNTTPFVTPANLEVYQLYLEQAQARFNGQVRSVSLTESGICTKVQSAVSAEDYQLSLNQQAATIAQYYYRAAMLSCITEFAYFKPHDREGDNKLKIGLLDDQGNKKPSYDVWKYIDTDKGFEVAAQYLQYLNPKATSYRDVMGTVSSKFNWDSAWNANRITGTQRDVNRSYGDNRWSTSLKVADAMKENLGLQKFSSIIVASGNDFADALAGSYLSTVKSAPILLGWGKGGKYVTLDEANIAYIKANLAPGGTVYILGGKNAVPELYETSLSGFTVKRLGGANRFETNLMILKEAGVKEGDEVLVCTATNFADSLSASATGKPILLVFNELGKLYGDQPSYLASLKNCTFTVVGGESAVSQKLADAIAKYGKVERLAGANRFETSVMVAEKYFNNPQTAVLAYAWNYPDGLCGGSLAFSMDAPLILTMTKYEAKATGYIQGQGIKTGVVLGGTTLISNGSVQKIFSLISADNIGQK